MKFEDKIKESAQRIVAEQNANLHVPANPLKQHKNYWGWIATPAAALVGIVLGFSCQHIAEKPNDQLAHVVDTVLVPLVQHDTLWLTQVEERVVEKTVWRERQPLTSQTVSVQAPVPSEKKSEEPACTSVSCDGINYAMLASN